MCQICETQHSVRLSSLLLTQLLGDCEQSHNLSVCSTEQHCHKGKLTQEETIRTNSSLGKRHNLTRYFITVNICQPLSLLYLLTTHSLSECPFFHVLFLPLSFFFLLAFSSLLILLHQLQYPFYASLFCPSIFCGLASPSNPLSPPAHHAISTV